MKIVTVPQSAIHVGKLILVNEKYPYLDKFASTELVTLQEFDKSNSLLEKKIPEETVALERNAATLLNALMEGIAGWSGIIPVSGWRSLEEQSEIYCKSMVQNGPNYTNKYVAKPGHSEHQTGLAIDLGRKHAELDFIRPDFPYSGICQTFRKNASIFGFVERYAAGKELITGIGHEPWHFRYVGTPHSVIMEEMGFALEEYITYLEENASKTNPVRYQKGSHHVSIYYHDIKEQANVQLELEATMPYSISGNNKNGIIVTVWES